MRKFLTFAASAVALSISACSENRETCQVGVNDGQ